MHCLPVPGGLFDQDSFFTYGMNLVLAAMKVKEEQEKDKPVGRR